MDASTFQKQFAFDNDSMIVFRLDLMNMPSHLVGISNWGVIDLKLLCGRYGVKWGVTRRRVPVLIDSVAIRTEFFAMKLQTTTALWAMITLAPT